MQALLVRVGVDHSYGHWNAPVDPATGRFVYVPIPESSKTLFHPGLERRYDEIMPALQRFCADHHRDLETDLRFPTGLLGQCVHLDPDFSHLTYGDDGNRRGSRMKVMSKGDLLVFYAGLKPISPCEHNLLYALIGLLVVDEVLPVRQIVKSRWHENAHTRKSTRGDADVVVRGQPGVSGRFNRCIPIGELRDRSYRVRPDALDAWGGLSVKDGYIQRSIVPPLFSNPGRFYDWFLKQGVSLTATNN